MACEPMFRSVQVEANDDRSGRSSFGAHSLPKSLRVSLMSVYRD